MKMNKKTIVILAIAASVIIIFFIFRRRKRKIEEQARLRAMQDSSDSSVTSPEDGTIVEPPSTSPTEGEFPLREGVMNSDYVKKLQESLNKLYDAGLAEDGDFGPLTKTAVEEYLFVSQVDLDMYTQLLQRASEDSADYWDWVSSGFGLFD